MTLSSAALTTGRHELKKLGFVHGVVGGATDTPPEVKEAICKSYIPYCSVERAATEGKYQSA